jgi:hypothetical protein
MLFKETVSVYCEYHTEHTVGKGQRSVMLFQAVGLYTLTTLLRRVNCEHIMLMYNRLLHFNTSVYIVYE